MDFWYWVLSALSLVGVWLNIQKKVLCFWIWAVTNWAWMEIDLQHGLEAQAVLQAIYFLFAVYGICKWGFLSNEEPPSEKARI